MNIANALEKIPVQIFDNSTTGSHHVATQIADLIREKHAIGKACVLGLATGSTPITLYKELVKLHKHEGLSFKNVISFNLDEYYGISQHSPQSYWSFMHRHLFNHIDIDFNLHLDSS